MTENCRVGFLGKLVCHTTFRGFQLSQDLSYVNDFLIRADQ